MMDLIINGLLAILLLLFGDVPLTGKLVLRIVLIVVVVVIVVSVLGVLAGIVFTFITGGV